MDIILLLLYTNRANLLSLPMTQPKYSVFYGIKELHCLHAASSLAFDTETLQLQPEKGKLRLLQLGSYTLRTIVVIDCFELTENNWNY